MMPRRTIFLTEDDVKSVIEWDPLVAGVRQIMSDVSSSRTMETPLVIQPSRTFMHIPQRNGVLLTMPALSERKRILSTKVVTSFLDNPIKHGLPTIMANILVFNPSTGKLRAVIEGTTITEWRTAAASIVATQTLKPQPSREDQILAVFGAGRQARIHIIAFQHIFKFKKVKLWNRTYQHGIKLAEELQREYKINVEVVTKIEDCASNADVIVTATYASEPIISYSQIKPGVMINAIGAGVRHHCELDTSIYEKSSIYTDSIDGANVELKGLIDDGFPVLGELGEIINGQKEVVHNHVIIFHSLGMALEDAVTAQIVLDKYLRSN